MLKYLLEPVLRLRQNQRLFRLEKELRRRVPFVSRLAKLGYARYKQRRLASAVSDERLLARFRTSRPLPEGYGVGMDERIVEYPWVLSRLGNGPSRLLDAGSTLNFAWVASAAPLRRKSVVVCDLAAEPTLADAGYSYVSGDLRSTAFDSASFDAIVCISTLEHVGMDNTEFYTVDARFRESEVVAYRDAVSEFRRLLAPGGRLFVTVPYGRYQNLGWLQQFDERTLDDAIDAFSDGRVEDITYYRHDPDRGWQPADARACAGCEFLYVRDGDDSAPVATSARAVACVELRARGA